MVVVGLTPLPPGHRAGVPKTKPLSELQAPVTKVTTLENGLRVATQETYGPVRGCVCVYVCDRVWADSICALMTAFAFLPTTALHLWAGGGRRQPGRGGGGGGRRLPPL